MYNYLSTVGPDYAGGLAINPVGQLFPEIGKLDQVVDVYDDDSEERVNKSPGVYFLVRLPWDMLSAADKETIVDFYFDTSKANCMKRSFFWTHPSDGQSYTCYFDSELSFTEYVEGHFSIQEIVLKVVGNYTGTTTTTTSAGTTSTTTTTTSGTTTTTTTTTSGTTTTTTTTTTTPAPGTVLWVDNSGVTYDDNGSATWEDN